MEPPSPQRDLLVVLHDRMYGRDPKLERINTPGVRFTEEQHLLSADAVIFHAPLDKYRRRVFAFKPRGQLWVAWSVESVVNYPSINHPIYDLRMTYQRDADVWTPYFSGYGADLPQRLRQPVPARVDNCLIASCISSDVNKNGRFEYLRELSRFIDIHHYGRFMRNRRMQNDCGRKSKLELYRQYKFVIAFENSTCADYVTEKLYDPLLAGAVPVYLGAPNTGVFAPHPDSYIDVNKFKNARELAGYIRTVARDDALLHKHTRWRREAGPTAFSRMIEDYAKLPGPFERLARAVQRAHETPRP